MTPLEQPDLYWISGSPSSWRVMLGLTIKGIPFASRRLDHGLGEYRSETYLAINPKGQLPTLVHSKVVVRESITVLAYIDRAWPKHPLFGTTASEASVVWQDVMVFEADLRPAAAVIAPSLLQNQSAARAGELTTAINAWLGALDACDARFKNADYVGPDGPAAAECWLFPLLGWIDRALALTTDPIPDALRSHVEDCPALTRWRKRLCGLPGVSDTFSLHWADTPAT